MNVNCLGYMGITSEHLHAWQDFCCGFLGLMNVSGDDDALRFKMDDQAWRIAIEPGDKEDLSYVGFDVRNGNDLATICHQLTTLGYQVEADQNLAASRGVAVLMKTTDPDGLQVELYYGATENSEQVFVSPEGVSGFVTGDQGFGHIVLYTGNETEKYQFYTEGLGFMLTDTILMGGQLMLTFLHCNPRHHTLALVSNPAGNHLNHFMLQTASLDDVGFAFDRAHNLELTLSTTLGCHTNDKMVSFYTQTPSGFDVEYGYGARIVDENWSVAHHNAASTWGHKRPTAAK